jgi:rhodanese-related sulfurtransferase
VVTARPPGARSIEEILAAARARLLRLTPQQAFGEGSGGGVLIDIRPAAQRAEQGEIPGSTIVERNHLEWRFDPCSDARLSWVTGYHHRVIVFCVDGYTSSLAAAALQDLGLHRATDVIGGFRAWTAEGLPSAAGGAGTVTLAPGAAPAAPPGAVAAASPGAVAAAPPGAVAASPPG